jgi:3-oxoacyl-[acyl-carrier-protein] synthase II
MDFNIGGQAMAKRRVVVTGLGGITSLGCGIEPTWEGLVNGRSGIDRIRTFDPSNHTSQIAAEAHDFNPLDYFPKTEAKKMDRYTQLALVSAEMALSDAGLDMEKIDGNRVGCILGTGIGGIIELENQKEILDKRGPSRVSPFLIPKMMPNAMSGVISIKFGLKGTNYVASSACASSGHALGLALRTVQYGESDVVITGGAEAAITPLALAGFCSLKALSTRNDEPTRASRPFDKDRDGFVLGEGAGVVVLEDYEHATRRGARIYAELEGFGATADAYHITAPKEDGEGPAQAASLALKDAEISPDEVDYVNAHGTSTPYNDVIETKAIKKAFGDHAPRLAISSTKSMIGHLLGGSSSVEFIVAVLSVYRQVVHPTLNLEEPDPQCDLDYVPGTARDMKIRHAASNSLGFGGHNVCVVLGKV